jgi:hypothetical protein
MFSDGTAVGDPAAIRSLWKRREWLREGYQEVFHHFDVATGGNGTDSNDREPILNYLTQMENMRFGPASSHEERASVKAAYDTVIGNLRANSKVPPSDVIKALRADEAVRADEFRKQLAPPQTRPQ